MLDVAEDALEAAVVPPVLATVFPSATAELAAAVALAEAGQLAAEGSSTWTLCVVVSVLRFGTFVGARICICDFR